MISNSARRTNEQWFPLPGLLIIVESVRSPLLSGEFDDGSVRVDCPTIQRARLEKKGLEKDDGNIGRSLLLLISNWRLES